MKAWFVLLLLLPVCLADYSIECYEKKSLWVRSTLQTCKSDVRQACYTREFGRRGCVSFEFCQRNSVTWDSLTCCYENRCNA